MRGFASTRARWASRISALLALALPSLVAAAMFIGGASASRTAYPAAPTKATSTRPSPPSTRPAPRGRNKLDAFHCTLPEGASGLPAGTLHGLISHLEQYPSVALATRAQRQAAQHLLQDLEAAATHWSTLQAARKAGFVVETVPRAKGDLSAHYVHAERLREGPIDTRLHIRRPKALIYANEPGRPLVLVGAMFSMRRGVRGPTPGGPITRWHSHEICAVGTKRGLAPRRDGSCPPGATRHQGSEMMHVWFTRDLRSAFAVRAPEPELCRDGLLQGHSCTDPSSSKGM